MIEKKTDLKEILQKNSEEKRRAAYGNENWK